MKIARLTAIILSCAGLWVETAQPKALATPGSLAQTNPPSSVQQSTELEEAKRLNQQVLQLIEQGQYQTAIPLAQQALAIHERLLGTEHPHVATSLNNLAFLYQAMGTMPFDKSWHTEGRMTNERQWRSCRSILDNNTVLVTNLSRIMAALSVSKVPLSFKPIFNRFLNNIHIKIV